jgi:hypothetical protein
MTNNDMNRMGFEAALEMAQIERDRYQKMLAGKGSKAFKDTIRKKLEGIEEVLRKHGIE